MDTFPECQVCHQQFTLKGSTPYLLPCLHAVCETCVSSTACGVISCSVCQSEVNLTETQLQIDGVRQKKIFHLTVQHRPSELLCTHEDDGNQAVCWCQECEEFLCEHCYNMHESFKATRRHAVQKIAALKLGSLNHEEYCNDHKTCPFDLWDRKCNVLICGRCKRNNHADHDVQDIGIAADIARDHLMGHEKQLQQAIDGHNSLLDKARDQIIRTGRQDSHLKDKITHTFLSLKTYLDQREKELLIAVDQRTSQTKSYLDSKTIVVTSSLVRCKMIAEYIQTALLYSSKYDLLKMSKTIIDSARSSLDSAPPVKQEDLHFPVFYTHGLDKLKKTLYSACESTTLESLFSQTPLEDELVISQAKVVQLQTTMQDVAREKENAKRHVQEMEEANKTREKRLKQLEDELMTSEANVVQLLTTMKDVTREKGNAERHVQEMEEANKTREKRLKQLKDELKTSEANVAQLLTVVEDIAGKRKNAECRAQEANRIAEMSDDERKTLERENVKLKKSIRKLETRIEDYKRRIETFEDEEIRRIWFPKRDY